MPPDSPFQQVSGGVQVVVRLTPRASRNLIEGVIVRADGSTAIKARVTAAPDKGDANAALLELLSDYWDIAKSQMRIKAGASSRNKIVLISGDPEMLLARLNRET